MKKQRKKVLIGDQGVEEKWDIVGSHDFCIGWSGDYCASFWNYNCSIYGRNKQK